MEKINIYDFEDYRLFLKAFYEAKKRSSGSFSYRRFSKLAENASPNFVKLVIDGQRNLTIENIYLFAVAMNLSPSEHDYFTVMVLANQAGHPESADYYRSKMRDKNPDIACVIRNPATFKSGLESYWDEAATWDIITLAQGKSMDEVKALAKESDALDEGRILKIIADATADGIIHINEEGLVRLVNKKMAIAEKWRSQSTKRFVQNQLLESKAASDLFYAKPYARFATVNFTFKNLKVLERKAARISQIISQEFFTDDDPDPEANGSVGRMSFQIFPVHYDRSEDPT